MTKSDASSDASGATAIETVRKALLAEVPTFGPYEQTPAQAALRRVEQVVEALRVQTCCPLCGAVQRQLQQPIREDPNRGEYAFADEPVPHVIHGPNCPMGALDA